MSTQNNTNKTGGKIVSIATNYLLKSIVENEGTWQEKTTGYKLNTKVLHPDNTYIAITSIGKSQEWTQECIEDSDLIKILFKGKKAVNLNPNHGQGPRNTIFVFELSDKGKEVVRQEIAEWEEKSKDYLPVKELWNIYYGYGKYGKRTKAEQEAAYVKIKRGEYKDEE